MNTFDDTMVRIARALADRTRLKIMREIVRRGTLSCREAIELVELAQPTVSHHIKILTDAGLLIIHKNGREVIMSINKEMMKKFTRNLTHAINTD